MAYDIPNLTLLRQFVVTAEEQGISRAAKRLRISQPALSKNIHKLEEMLQIQLFDRHANGTSLTDAGRVFLEHAQVISLEYQHALQDIRNMVSEQGATIRVGAGPIWSSTILPQAATRFHELYPRHRMQVLTGSIDELTEALRLGRIDIFAGAILEYARVPGFQVRKLARSTMAVLAHQSHPLMQRSGAIEPIDITAHPFVAFTPSRDVITILSSYLKSHGAPPPRIVLETSSLFACVEVLRTGQYLLYETAMLTESRIGEELRCVPVHDLRYDYDLGLIYREGLDRIPVYRGLMRLMANELGVQVPGWDTASLSSA